MAAMPRIAVLLSTYNGERYLGEQLDSILAQTFGELVIVARDDGSADGTWERLTRFAADHPGRLVLMERDRANLGPARSYSALMEHVLARKRELGLEPAYMMLCDQDDVWHPHKAERQMRAMLAAEAESGGLPVLVHSDLEVVSQDNRLIAGSFIAYQGLDVGRGSFPEITIYNLVTGCTALANEALVRRAAPVPEAAFMHDWWMAMVAAAFGRRVFLSEPLVRYRQHGGNAIGAREFVPGAPPGLSFWRRLADPAPHEGLLKVARQAGAFRRRFGRQLSLRHYLSVRLSACMRVPVGFVQRFLCRLACRL